MAAGLGLDATGVDLAANALRTAGDKAHARGRAVRFLRHDARRLGELGEVFDTVLDCGLFHIFDGENRAAYVAALRAAVPAGGRYFMLGFSDRQQGEWGRVHKLTRVEIEAAFADGLRVDSIEPSTIEIATDSDGIQAWLVERNANRRSPCRDRAAQPVPRPALQALLQQGPPPRPAPPWSFGEW
ncbi:hypothetical protein BN159_1425 [Streptomyces davaonensis JCM 4913]|uniref:Methyltransferase domain-containing protein n=2 Tax=Streptomyces davaonensis TaxID=348043 RepID=K4QZL7_STRDJ|nr:hypothetical protein BN159_1425 [Streptomyces davaonensis JCM 4913]